MTRFLVAKEITKSLPLLSLDTSVKLGILHVFNATQKKSNNPQKAALVPRPQTTFLNKIMVFNVSLTQQLSLCFNCQRDSFVSGIFP